MLQCRGCFISSLLSPGKAGSAPVELAFLFYGIGIFSDFFSFLSNEVHVTFHVLLEVKLLLTVINVISGKPFEACCVDKGNGLQLLILS